MFSFSIKSQIQVDTVVSTYVTGSVRVDSSVVINDSVKITEDVTIFGDLNMKGGGIYFKNGTGINVTSATGSEIYSYGSTSTSARASVNACSNPNTPTTGHQFGGLAQVYDADAFGNYTGGSIMSFQSWTGASSIDVAGGSGLLMNYFCGKDIFLCTGASGKVEVGDEFYPRKNVQIGPLWHAKNPNVALSVYSDGLGSAIKLWPDNINVKLLHDASDRFVLWGNGNTHLGNNVQIGFGTTPAIQDANTSLNINNAGLDGIKFNVWNNVAKIIHLNNVNTPFASYSPFIIYGDGNTQMGQAVQIGQTQSGIKSLAVNLNISSVNTQSAIVVNNGTKDVFRVLKNGETRIGGEIVTSRSGSLLHVGGEIDCKSLFVLKPTTWSDCVFEKGYKLYGILDEENYITDHGHLRGIPSEQEILKNGYDLNEMDAKLLAKLEEAYLHIIKLQKEVEELKQKIK
jgi:hypothetical protein